MNRAINELIPKAINAIVDSGMAINGKVEKEYKGYISSMGASILQSGLIATMAFYSKNADGSGAKRTNLLKAICLIINPSCPNNSTLLKHILNKTRAANNNNNNVKVSALKQTELKEFEKKISDALVALKLALRTYEQKK